MGAPAFNPDKPFDVEDAPAFDPGKPHDVEGVPASQPAADTPAPVRTQPQGVTAIEDDADPQVAQIMALARSNPKYRELADKIQTRAQMLKQDKAMSKATGGLVSPETAGRFTDLSLKGAGVGTSEYLDEASSLLHGGDYKPDRDFARKTIEDRDERYNSRHNLLQRGAVNVMSALPAAMMIPAGRAGAAVAGGIAGYGGSKSDSIGGQALDTAVGAGLGLVGNEIAGGVLKYGQKGVGKIMELAGQMGMKPQEVIDKLFGTTVAKEAREAAATAAAGRRPPPPEFNPEMASMPAPKPAPVDPLPEQPLEVMTRKTQRPVSTYQEPVETPLELVTRAAKPKSQWVEPPPEAHLTLAKRGEPLPTTEDVTRRFGKSATPVEAPAVRRGGMYDGMPLDDKGNVIIDDDAFAAIAREVNAAGEKNAANSAPWQQGQNASREARMAALKEIEARGMVPNDSEIIARNDAVLPDTRKFGPQATPDLMAGKPQMQRAIEAMRVPDTAVNPTVPNARPDALAMQSRMLAENPQVANELPWNMSAGKEPYGGPTPLPPGAADMAADAGRLPADSGPLMRNTKAPSGSDADKPYWWNDRWKSGSQNPDQLGDAAVGLDRAMERQGWGKSYQDSRVGMPPTSSGEVAAAEQAITPAVAKPGSPTADKRAKIIEAQRANPDALAAFGGADPSKGERGSIGGKALNYMAGGSGLAMGLLTAPKETLMGVGGALAGKYAAKAGARVGAEAVERGAAMQTPEAITQSWLANPSLLAPLAQQPGNMGAGARYVLQGLKEAGQEGLKSRLWILNGQPWFRAMMAKDQDGNDAR